MSLTKSIKDYENAMKAWKRYKSLEKTLEALKAAAASGLLPKEVAAAGIWSISKELQEMKGR